MNGTLLSSPPISASDRGSERGAPFGVPVVPLVRIVIRGAVPGFGGALVSAPSIASSSVGSLDLEPSSVHARHRPRGSSTSPEHLLVLVVEHEQVASPHAGNLPDLRAGERGVQEDDPRAALGRREHRLEEPAVVSYENRDPLAGLQASFAPGIRERVGALVELRVAQLAALVDHRGAIAVADAAGDHRPAEQPEPLEAEQQLGDAVWQLGAEHPAADAQQPRNKPRRRGVRRAVPRPRASPGVEVYDRFLLTLCDPLFPRNAAP